MRLEVKGEAVDERQFLIEMAVIDSGIGIAPEDQSRIFETFSRLDPAYTTQRPAPGLGLAMAQQLIRDLQGTLTVESALGKGSCFRLQLPLLISEQEASA